MSMRLCSASSRRSINKNDTNYLRVDLAINKSIGPIEQDDKRPSLAIDVASAPVTF